MDFTRKLEQKKFGYLLEGDESGEIRQFKEKSKLYHEIKQIVQQENFVINQVRKKDSLHAIMLMTHLNFIFLEYCKENTEEYAQIRELIINYFNCVIKNYIQVKSNINLIHRIQQVQMNNELLTDLYHRIEAFSAYQKVLEILEMYQYNLLDFELHEKKIKLIWNQKYDLLSRIIAERDFLDKHNVNNMMITNEFDEEQKKGCFCQDEMVYREKMKTFFMTDNLKIKMGEYFSIEKWIKIFVILSKVSTQYLEKNHYKILIKTKKDWITNFKISKFIHYDSIFCMDN